MDELQLRIAFQSPHGELLECLTQSLETYPELQWGFLRQLERRVQPVA